MGDREVSRIDPEMKPLKPVSVIDLLADERAELLALLSQLSDEQWAAPTVCVSPAASARFG